MPTLASDHIAEARRAGGDPRSVALRRALEEVARGGSCADPAALAASVGEIGGLWEESGDLGEARGAYAAGVELLVGRTGAERATAVLLDRLSAVLHRMFRPLDAVSAARAALALPGVEESDPAFARRVRIRLAGALLQLGELGAATDVARLVRESARAGGDRMLRRALELLPDATFLVAGDGTIVFSNTAAERMFGGGKGAPTTIAHVLPDVPAAESGGWPATLLGDPHAQWVARVVAARRADGTAFPVEVSASSLPTEQGVVALFSMRDVTAREEADRALRAALAELEVLKRRLEKENVALRGELETKHEFAEILGRSLAIRRVLEQVELVAPTDASVLLLGETGTGKELFARAIHRASRRRHLPLVTVDCTVLPETLIESELFGHEKGAFTGAAGRREGRFEIADGGTIFLDEIGDMPLPLQSKLLRVLQEGEFQRLGSAATHRVDVRVLAATHRDLAAMVRDGRFRADLYYRLSVVPIPIPPLRERREDVPVLAWYFVEVSARRCGKRITDISAASMERLAAYDWPGNVRELHNVIERAVILSRTGELRFDEPLGDAGAPPARTAAASPPESLVEVEREHILAVLEACRWQVKGRGQAADRLKMNPSTLRSRMRKLGIARPGA